MLLKMMCLRVHGARSCIHTKTMCFRTHAILKLHPSTSFSKSNFSSLLKSNKSKVPFSSRTYATKHADAVEIQPPPPSIVIYRGVGMRQLRFFSRFKVIHLCLTALLTGPICYDVFNGNTPSDVAVFALTAVLGSGVMLTAFSFYVRRLAGEIAFVPSKNELVFGTLTFWGNRNNTAVPLADIVPPLYEHTPAQVGARMHKGWVKLERFSGKPPYFINTRYCMVPEKELFMQFLKGETFEAHRVREALHRAKTAPRPQAPPPTPLAAALQRAMKRT
eukprot:Colp12_sorted_trinity150504_noHs@9498